MSGAAVDILLERAKRNAARAKPSRNPFAWSASLSETAGEFSREALRPDDSGTLMYCSLRERAVKCAAAAMVVVDTVDHISSDAEENRADEDVLRERARQDAKWGKPDHSPLTWSAILAEEVGEFARAILRFGTDDTGNTHGIRKEAIQCAAVAMAIAENLDRVIAEREENAE